MTSSAMLISSEELALPEAPARARRAPSGAQARRPGDAAALTRRGILRAKAGDLPGAIEDYGAALEVDPDQLTARANRGVASFHLGDFATAVADCSRALELAPDLSKAWLIRGLARAKLGELAAEDDLLHFAKLAPTSKYLPMARRALRDLDA
ncbi:MAG: tetratricopeptide repeat protein [Planctomycetota bacterium]